MSKNTNRDYIIIIDVKSSDILEADTLQFYINDNESHNIFVQLVIKDTKEPINKYVSIDDPSKYVVKMNIVKPTNEHETLTSELVSVEDSLYQFVLPNSCVNNIGTYKCEVETCYNNRVTNSNKIRYKIKKSILNDLDSVVKAPGYPIVIQLLDKLSDIEKYEEDRRAAELARQLAEEQRKTNYDELVADMTDSIEAIDNKVVDVENRISNKEQAVDKLIVDTKTDINDYKTAKDIEIDEYKTAKDTEINQAIANQDNKISEAITKQDKNISDAIADQNNKIDTAIEEQNNRIGIVEASDNTQNTRLDALEAKDIAHESRITNIEAKNVEQDNRLDSIEAVNASQGTRLDAIEIKNQQQDDRLLDVEKVNKRQDMDLKCLFAESKNNMIDVTEEGNSIYLQNSTVGYTLIDEIQGNTMVNCNKEADKEIILNGNINTQGYSNVTLTEGVDGGLVDVALEGNTMVNVCDQKDSVALPFNRELTYLYANTLYAVQFVSDAVSKVNITLGGAELLNQDVVLGINKYTITTPSELIDNNLVLNGEDFNASNIVVTQATDQDFGYFEGMKSVGECEDLEVVSCNKNLFDDNIEFELGGYDSSKGKPYQANDRVRTKDKLKLKAGSYYVSCLDNPSFIGMSIFDLNGKFIKEIAYLSSDYHPFDLSFDCEIYLTLGTANLNLEVQLEEGSTATDYIPHAHNTQTLTHEPLRAVGDTKDKYVLIDGKWYIERNCGVRAYQEGDIDNYITDMINTVYPLSSPIYEPIDYNPFEVYSEVTHISNNSTIPASMVIKNTGYNCLLKPSTTYTVSSNLGLNTVTTPSVLSEDCLRFYDTDTSDVTTMKNVLVLEGDYTTNGKPIPSHFSGIESAFEQEYDEGKGKYKVKIRIQNKDASRENYIEFYINEPLRGIGDVKDRVYVKNDKVAVERKCGQREYQDGDFGTYLTDKVNTVYPLAEPIYEEVEYNDVKLFIESFKNSTLFYNSNIPVTSKVWYSYSVPIVDTVAQTANVTDQQDSMIIDLATQCAIMEMYLM